MEEQRSPFDWDFCFYEDEEMEELRYYSLLKRTSELETKVALAKEEIKKKENELVHLKDFLTRAIKERDEAESKCQSIMLDILNLQQQRLHQKQAQEQQKLEEEKESHFVDHHFPNRFDTDNGIIESEQVSRDLDLPPRAEGLVAGKPLPEKGKLLQAVMKAGPLLQTLLLAGPLPQWQHPPPRVNSIEIPPVAVSFSPMPSFLPKVSCLSHKRSLPHSVDSVFNSNTKYQKVLY